MTALDVLGPYLEDFSASATADDEFSMTVMRRHGVPDELATALQMVGGAFRAFGSSGQVTVPLRQGTKLTLRARTLTALHRPGHSPSDTVFWDERRHILVAGDHLLSRISSNPLISRPLGATADGVGERPRALQTYIASLQATRGLDARIVLGGHGPPVTDHTALIDERMRLTRRRAQTIARLLEPGPRTAYELAGSMWANVAVTQAFLTLSEVLGHLDLLVADGEVAEEDGADDLVRFRLR